jgi:fatty acid desaturase
VVEEPVEGGQVPAHHVAGEKRQRRGVRLLRALVILVVALVVLWLLFFHVFPWVERYLEDPTIGALATAALTAAGRG